MAAANPAARSRSPRDIVIANAPWVAIVLAAAAFGQWLVLHDGAVPIVSSDGLIYYLPDAHALPGLQGLVDAKVPAGYPLLLGLAFLIGGRDNLDVVLAIQAVLLVAAAVETYALLTVIGFHRLVATIVAAALAAAPWLVQWERYVLAESLSVWLIVTLFLAFTQLLRHPNWRWGLVCGLVGAAIPMTRAALVLIPGTLLVVFVVRQIALRRARQHLAAAIVFGIVAYLPAAVYIVANAAVNGCYCYTSIGNLNLFGKIFEYGMKDLPADPKYATIAQQVAAADGPNDFLASHPEYARQNYSPLSAYARSQFVRYPGTVVRHTMGDLRNLLVMNVDHAVLLEHPYACLNDPNLPYPLVTGDALQAADVPLCSRTNVSVGKLGEDVNRVVYGFIFLAYVLLPLSLVLGAALAWMQPRREHSWLLLAVSGVVSAVLLTASITGYIAFDRLKIPVDSMALVSGVLLVGELWFVATRLRRALRNPTEPAPARSA